MKFEFYEMIPTEVGNSLAAQGICLDDWNYMLFFEDAKEFGESKEFGVTLKPKLYNVEQLLNGCCHNVWYPVGDFMGRKGVLGVAYHA